MELVLINLLTEDELCISNRYDFNLAEHLANDNTDMLIVDVYTLLAVNVLDFIHKIILKSVFTEDCKYILWIWRSGTELFTSFYLITITYKHTLCHWNKVLELLTIFISNRNYALSFANIFEFNSTRDLCKYTWILWFACFEEFRYTRKTSSNILRLLCFLVHLSNHVTGLNRLFIINEEDGSCWEEVVTLWVTSFISNDDTWLFYIKVKICDVTFCLTCLKVNLLFKCRTYNYIFEVDISVAFCKDRLNELFEFTDYFTLLNDCSSLCEDCRTVRDFNLLFLTCDVDYAVTLNNLTVNTGKNFLALVLKDNVAAHKALSIFNKKLIICSELNLVENTDYSHEALTSKEPLVFLLNVSSFNILNECIELKNNLVIVC